MLHVRGTPGDYNGWAKVVGDERWNASSMASQWRIATRRKLARSRQSLTIMSKVYWLSTIILPANKTIDEVHFAAERAQEHWEN
jgi:hypothetical protein